MDERLVGVPPESFICDRTAEALRFKGDQAQLKNAPIFRLSEWNKATGQAELGETYHRFGTDPYFFVQSQPLPGVSDQGGQVSKYYSFNGQNALPRLGYISRATKLMGTTARSQQDEKLGTVNNLVIDLPAGRIVEVILGSSGGFLGTDRELSAVPPQAFHWNADNSALALDITREAFRTSPHFKSSQWGYAYEPGSIAAVYSSYKVPQYFTVSGMDNGAQNVREQTDEGVTALEKGNAEDVKITDQIRQAIQSNGATSAAAGNVKILTADGKVTLRGTVNSQDEKQMIADTAARFVSASNVDNQLEVRQVPTPFRGY